MGRAGDAINKHGVEEGLERYCSQPDLPMTYVGCAMSFTLAVRSGSQRLCDVVHVCRRSCDSSARCRAAEQFPISVIYPQRRHLLVKVRNGIERIAIHTSAPAIRSI